MTFEENAERLKIVIPIRRNWPLFSLFSTLLVVWLVMIGLVGRFLLAEPATWLVRLAALAWLLLWLWFGRSLWQRWQTFAANREILFINRQQLILRRPVSLLGLTTVYDMKHVSPFYVSDKHHCPAFDYAFQHVYFGQSLAASEANDLVTTLNGRFFPS
ncbi:MAG: hypothetical protein AB1791_18660 [Chloroflexota bacterium]